MAHDELLHDVNGFLSSQDSVHTYTDSLNLEDLDSQQLIADTDALLQSLNRSASTPKSAFKTKQEIAKEKAGQRRDAYRLRLKTEWATLRQQDIELSERLEKLKQLKTQEETQSSPSDSLALGAWRAIAMRQYESRMEAEALHKRLEAEVKSRSVMIQDLETVLRKRIREVEKMSTIEVPEILEKKARLGTKDAILYNTYFENLDALYERLEEIFKSVGVDPTPGGILSGDPIKKTDAEGEFPGVNSDETGWAIVHGPTSEANYLADPTLTLVQACIRMVPMRFQDSNDDDGGNVDQFMQLLAKTGVEDNKEIERMMERLLLDDALATDGLEFDVDGNLTSVVFGDDVGDDTSCSNVL
ncbi:Hypothetical protein PHPALM_15594 [Phytophthora palmivora]|uniref:Uncharacterized protein n=1 Tax=Phytophthora palmivora TaxID=4796 RepID=A0A2P4XS01_9STRA|nr:Hypothetical protein PHPALM_15594 [Phytophthora palmivora]